MITHQAINFQELVEIHTKISNRISSGEEKHPKGFLEATYGRMEEIQKELPRWMKTGLFYLGQLPDGRGLWLWDGEIRPTYAKVMCNRCRKNHLLGTIGQFSHIWYCIHCDSSGVYGLHVETGDFFD